MSTGSTDQTLRSERLLLRRWRPEDEAPMAAINRDPEVRRHLNRPLDPAGVASFYGSLVDHWAAHGYGPWAVEPLTGTAAGRCVGFVGLFHLPPYLGALEAHPEIDGVPEIGWRLGREAWGGGLATEGATLVRDHAFDVLGLPRLMAMIHPDNVRSQRVAEKLGMSLRARVPNPALGISTGLWAMTAAQRPARPGISSPAPSR